MTWRDRLFYWAIKRTPQALLDRIVLHEIGGLSTEPELAHTHVPSITVNDIIVTMQAREDREAA